LEGSTFIPSLEMKWPKYKISGFANSHLTLKQALIAAPVLGYPNFNKPFILACDASGSAIGYILSQLGDDNKEHVIGYGGRALTNNTGAIIKACFNVLKAFSQSLVHLKLISFVNKRFNGVAIFA
jgi:hypothetical protein